MQPRRDDLWQGGPWEQQGRVVPASVPQKKKRRLKRPVIVFLGTIGLICILTAVGLLLREDMPWSAPDASGPVSLPDNQEQNRDPAAAHHNGCPR